MKKVLKLLTLMDIILFTSFGFISPIFAIFIEGELVGGGIEAAGIAGSIYFLAKAGLQIPAGKLSDKYGKKKILLLGMGLMNLTLFGYVFMQNVSHLFILQALYGIGAALNWPAWEGIFSVNLKKGAESYGWSVYNFFIDMGAAISAFLGGVIATTIGFRLLFLIGALVSCASLFLCFLINPKDTELWKSDKNIIKKVGGIIISKKKLFLIKSKGTYSLPGGEVRGEDLDLPALVGTIGEDLEKNVKIKDVIFFKEYKFKTKPKQTVIKTYLCKPDILPKSSGKFIWINKKDLLKLKSIPLIKKMVEDLVKARLIE